MNSKFFLFLFLSHCVNFLETAWSPESTAQQKFDFDCPPGESVNGVILQSTKASSDLTGKGVMALNTDAQAWTDCTISIFCKQFSNSNGPTSGGQASRFAQEFALSKGVDAKDSSKNCADDEFICGISGSYANNQRNLKYKCCKNSIFKRSDSCQTVGPAKLSNVNPNELKNPSAVGGAAGGGRDCAPQAAVAFGIGQNGAQMLFCEFRENGKQYPPTCEEKKLHDIEESNKKVDEKRREQPQSKIDQPKAVMGSVQQNDGNSTSTASTVTSQGRKIQNSTERSVPTDSVRRNRTETSSVTRPAAPTGSTTRKVKKSEKGKSVGGTTPAWPRSTWTPAKPKGPQPGSPQIVGGPSNPKLPTIFPPKPTAVPITPAIFGNLTESINFTAIGVPTPPPTASPPKINSPPQPPKGDNVAVIARDSKSRPNQPAPAPAPAPTPAPTPVDAEFCICLCNQKCSLKSNNGGSESNRQNQTPIGSGKINNPQKDTAPSGSPIKTGTGNSLTWKESTVDGKSAYVIMNEEKLKICPASKCNCGCVCN